LQTTGALGFSAEIKQKGDEDVIFAIQIST